MLVCLIASRWERRARREGGKIPRGRMKRLRREAKNVKRKDSDINPSGAHGFAVGVSILPCADTQVFAAAYAEQRQVRQNRNPAHIGSSPALPSVKIEATSQLTRMEPRYLEYRASGEPCVTTSTARRRRGCGNGREATKQTYKWPPAVIDAMDRDDADVATKSCAKKGARWIACPPRSGCGSCKSFRRRSAPAQSGGTFHTRLVRVAI